MSSPARLDVLLAGPETPPLSERITAELERRIREWLRTRTKWFPPTEPHPSYLEIMLYRSDFSSGDTVSASGMEVGNEFTRYLISFVDGSDTSDDDDDEPTLLAKMYIHTSGQKIDGRWTPCLDIASVDFGESLRNKGIFTTLLKSLINNPPTLMKSETCPDGTQWAKGSPCSIFIEGVVNPSLQAYLSRSGWIRIGEPDAQSYAWDPSKPFQSVRRGRSRSPRDRAR